MKNFTLLLAVIFVFVSCSENKKESLIKYGLKGNVKSIEAKTFNAVEKFGDVSKSGEMIFGGEIVCFDKQGKEVMTWIKVGNNKQLKSMYFHDKNGLVKEFEKSSYGEDVFERTTYKYDPAGTLIEKEITDKSDQTIKRTKIKSDKEGKYLLEVNYDQNNKLTDIERKTFSSEKRLIKSSTYDQEDRELLAHYYQHDERGNIITETITLQGEPIAKIERTYDKRDLMIWLVHTGIDKTTEMTYEYELDKQGNWIKMILYVYNKKPVQIVERDIKYH